MNLKQNITSYGRFKGLPWFNLISNSTIFVGGAGGIGSHLAFQLARTGANIIIADVDTVGEENLAGQLYGKEDIGKLKVKAISDIITRLCGENNITIIEEKIEKQFSMWQVLIPRCDIVCVGFDNLEARRLVYEEWRKNGKEHSLFIDGRMSVETGEVYTLAKNSNEEQFTGYENTYFPAHERVEAPCSMKATTHCGSLIASLMTTQITNWFNNQNENNMPREVANINFHLPLMLFTNPVFKQTKVEELC